VVLAAIKGEKTLAELAQFFDVHRVLRVGRVALLLDLTKLGLDQVVASVFPLEFVAQPI
jgi:hypothetical protein